MKKVLSFDDVLIVPRFSMIRSRADVSLSRDFCDYRLDLPVISSNMDTITESAMAQAMGEAGGVGALHRFCSIEENVAMFKKVNSRQAIVSVGLGTQELERAKALSDAGADNFLIDVAHGAAIAVVNQYDELRRMFGKHANIIVGNFATKEGIESFNFHSNCWRKPNAFKVGIGGGSMCTTRVVTGCGLPTLASVIDCARANYPIIADGGLRTSGDIAKALAAGASTVMLGGMLSGTKETPGEIVDLFGDVITAEQAEDHSSTISAYKKYRGSASLDSYKVQGKVAAHRSPEGEATTVMYKGSVQNVLEQISGGLKSALSYVGADNLRDFPEYAELVEITTGGILESRAHGVRK